MKRFLTALLLTAMITMPGRVMAEEGAVVGKGKKVKLNYDLKIAGELVDSTRDREAVEFVYGEEPIMPGLEEGILGMKAGEEKHLEITPDKGFGEVNQEAFVEVPKDRFPPDQEIKEGMMFQPSMEGPEAGMGGVVKEVKESSIVLDFNHPLAGKTFTMDVTIIEVI